MDHECVLRCLVKPLLLVQTRAHCVQGNDLVVIVFLKVEGEADSSAERAIAVRECAPVDGLPALSSGGLSGR